VLVLFRTFQVLIGARLVVIPSRATRFHFTRTAVGLYHHPLIVLQVLHRVFGAQRFCSANTYLKCKYFFRLVTIVIREFRCGILFNTFIGIYFTTLLECDPRKGQLRRVLTISIITIKPKTGSMSRDAFQNSRGACHGRICCSLNVVLSHLVTVLRASNAFFFGTLENLTACSSALIKLAGRKWSLHHRRLKPRRLPRTTSGKRLYSRRWRK